MDRHNFYHPAFSEALERAARDRHLLPSHISLLAAILYFGQQGAPHDPFQVSRRKLMRFSHIRSTGTYHKCLRTLIEGGYIYYQPAWHPKKGSKITLRPETVKT